MGQIKVTKLSIEGLYIIEPAVHGDERGYFMETYNQKDMEEAGLNMTFVQDNQTIQQNHFLVFQSHENYKLDQNIFHHKP